MQGNASILKDYFLLSKVDLSILKLLASDLFEQSRRFLTPSHSFSEVRLKFRNKFKQLPQVGRSVSFRVKRSIISINFDIAGNTTRKVTVFLGNICSKIEICRTSTVIGHSQLLQQNLKVQGEHPTTQL